MVIDERMTVVYKAMLLKLDDARSRSVS